MTESEELAHLAWLWNLERWADEQPCKGSVAQRQHWAVHGDQAEIARERYRASKEAAE